MPELILCDHNRIEEVIPLATIHHCGIEIQAFHDPELLNKEPNAILIHHKALSDFNVRSLHGPYVDLFPGSTDRMIREVARKRFNLAANIARQLNATHIIIHNGYVPYTHPPEVWISNCTEFWQDFLDSIPTSIKVHLENYLELDPELLSDVVHSINRPNLDICLDIGHAHCHSKKTLLQWIERLNRQIGYVHLHDNHGESDEHLGLGYGTIPMLEVCQALLRYAPEALWALEAQAPYTEQSINWLKEHCFFR